ncbi:Transcriptional regulator [Phlyctochytrium planicorne]|nr:Transcriptional regulator [Phlyctochytrium planicorne]
MINLNFNEMPISAERYRQYQQYVTSQNAQGVAVPPAKGPTDLPSLSEIKDLMAEMEELKKEAEARELQLSQNLEVINQWLKKNESKPSVAIGQATSGENSPNLVQTPSFSPALSKPDKKKHHSGKLKNKEDSTIKSEVEVIEDSPIIASNSLSPQLKKKRKREKETEAESLDADKGHGSVLCRKTEDGSVKIEITQNGKLKLKIPATSPPPPSPVPVAPPAFVKAPSRANTPKPLKQKGAKGSAEKMKVKQKKRGKAELAEDPAAADAEKKDENQIVIEGDYSKAKAPPNQIPIAQFWSFCDSQFFRALQDEDFAFLDNKGDEVTPFIVPLLGRHYLEQWAEEEGAMMPQSDIVPSSEDIEDTIYGGDSYLGSLTERVLSSLQEEAMQMHMNDFDNGLNDRMKPRPRSTAEIMVLEDRLKNEIRFLGLIGDEDMDPDQKEEDEITAELKRLQQELRTQVMENTRRKQRLKEAASFYRGWEQYNTVLDTLSKQIESDYLKRFKQNPKNRRKIKVSHAVRTIPEATLENIEKRKTLIEKIGCLFPPEKVTIPQESIYNVQ